MPGKEDRTQGDALVLRRGGGRAGTPVHHCLNLIKVLAGLILFKFAFEGMLGAVTRLWEIAVSAIL
jgi:hypothetical protein